MTTTLRAFAPYLLPLLLAGCPSAPVAPDHVEVGSAPDLEVLYSVNLLYMSLDFLVFSEDGSTFAAGGVSDGIGLYRISDYSKQERHYERERSVRDWLPGYGKPTADIIDVGYIDANTWYFSAVTRAFCKTLPLPIGSSALRVLEGRFASAPLGRASSGRVHAQDRTIRKLAAPMM
ncbi:MAG: hypothetical protein LBF91_03745 [Azoarcus sp.]|jgi:hypothetical protein|nr:hypothetical protein [Azoarcus sp.]